jgi:hypothetical protein
MLKVAQNELLEIPLVPGLSLVSDALSDDITAELQKVQQEDFPKVVVTSAALYIPTRRYLVVRINIKVGVGITRGPIVGIKRNTYVGIKRSNK